MTRISPSKTRLRPMFAAADCARRCWAAVKAEVVAYVRLCWAAVDKGLMTTLMRSRAAAVADCVHHCWAAAAITAEANDEEPKMLSMAVRNADVDYVRRFSAAAAATIMMITKKTMSRSM